MSAPSETPPPSFWDWAIAEPDRRAILDGDRTITYGELASQAHRIGNALRTAGVDSGDVVAMMLPNGPTTIAILLALQQTGVSVVPVSQHLVADEIAYLLSDSQAKAIVTEARFGAAVVGALDTIGDAPKVRFSVGQLDGFISLDDAMAAEPDTPPRDRGLGSVMFYTSGTTGRPKAVERPSTGAPPPPEAVGLGVLGYFGLFEIGYGDDEVGLVSGPMYHAAPQAWGLYALHIGHAIVVPERWTAEGALQAIERHKVTYGFMVPTHFQRLLDLPDDVRARYDVSSLRKIVHAAAPCPPSVKQDMMAWLGPVIWEFYAGTEGGGTLARPEEWLAHPGTVGRAWPGGDVRIFDDDGNEVPTGEAGAVGFKTTMGAFKYRNDPEKTERAFVGDFLTLGDIGHLDDEGYLFLLDRRTDLIITGGVNVYPAEIEAVLTSHPKVLDAAVFGLPDPDWGQSVCAVVQPARDVVADDELRGELLAECAVKLAKLKVPKRIDFRAELPRMDNGKLYKRRLRDEYLASEGQTG